MTVHDRYVLNVEDGIDTIHRNPGEQCNLDDSPDEEHVPEGTAKALIDGGSAERCGHCYREDPS